MTQAQIKHMVGRFLSWKLPETFSPDAGISFKPAFNEHTSHPMRHEPCGTNLLSASQAEEMVRHMLEGLPPVDHVEGRRYAPITDGQIQEIMACGDVSTARIKIARLIHNETKDNSAKDAEAARLRRMVERRDEFIIGKSLWNQFKEVMRETK